MEEHAAALIDQKVAVVRRLVAAYLATPGNDDAEVRRVDDLYGGPTGLPR